MIFFRPIFTQKQKFERRLHFHFHELAHFMKQTSKEGAL